MVRQSTLPLFGAPARSLLSLLAAAGLMLGMVAGIAAQDKPTVTVGSKQFTEQLILGELLAQLLEEADYEVERQIGLASTAVVHEALLSGDVDTYVEYTGTGLITILGEELPTVGGTPSADAAGTPAATNVVDAVYDIVKRGYQEQFEVAWLDPLGFTNTYVLAMTEEQAAELGVTKISDLIPIAGDLTFAGTQEFLTRPDGLAPLLEAYEGLEFEDERGLDEGLLYGAVDEGDVDVISAFSTDGRIGTLGLTLLEDDLNFYPPYFAAPVVRQELLDEDPAVAEVLNQLAGLIDNETMGRLNLEGDEGGEEPEDVARTFLEEQGLVGQ